MPDNLEKYRKLAERMIQADRDRNLAFQGYEDMYHCKASFPNELNALPWFRKVVSTDPHDAIEGGTRIMTSTEPRITVMPLADDIDNKEEANKRERILGWHLKNSNRRRSNKVEADIMRSALMYSAVAANVIDLDWQVKNVGAMGGNDKRWKAMRRLGRFQINTYNPKDVHVQRSGQMVERVLLCQKRSAQEIVDTYGTVPEGVKKLAEEDAAVVFYDYWDLDVHCTWCEPGNTYGRSGSEGFVILPATPHDMPFIPWVALMGGSTLEDKEEHKYHPMLYSVYQAHDWDTQNIVKSLYVSEVIRNAGTPPYVESGPSEETTEVDAAGEMMVAKVPPANQLQALPRPTIDTSLLALDDRLTSKTEKSTMSRVLLGGDLPSGTAFETLNLMTQTALGALKPSKTLSEQALAEILTLMLLWAHYTGEGLEAYGTDKRNDIGAVYKVEADEIDPESLYIEVELNSDEPTDRQQRANTAVQLMQIGYPKEYALQDMGVADPLKAIEQSYYERLLDHEINLKMQQDMAAMQMQMQQVQQAAQMQMQQQQQAQMMAEQQRQAQGIPGGEGFNPAMGGQSPINVNSTVQTRERVTGETRGGVPIGEGL
ncbi:MAG: hypothetical protein WC455_27355 [Dehalococcoidia bacterium]|jgi:hypothetical protein